MLRSLLLSSATLVLCAQTPAPQPAEPAAAAAKPAPAPAPKAPEAAAPKVPAAKAPAVAPAVKAPAAAPKAPVAEAPKVDKVLAVVGTEVVKESDFELFLQVSMGEQQRMQMQMMPGAKDQYRTRFLEFKALAAKARKEGFAKTPEFAKKMALMNMQVLIQSLMDRDGPALQAKLALTDAEVQAYFKSHPEKFTSPEKFSARHILVGTRPQGAEKALTDDEAKAKIAKIQAELKGGKKFEDAAKEYSDDPGSKDKGGLYPDTPFGQFVPEFEKAVRTQAVGVVGEPVKTNFGYHLIQVEKITPAAPQTFETAKEAAKQQAVAERQEKVMKTYMDAVKKEVGFREGAAKAAAKPASAKKVAK